MFYFMVLYISIVVEKSFSGDQSFRALRIVEICAKICTVESYDKLWQLHEGVGGTKIAQQLSL